VGVLLPSDNEKETEQTIHFLRSLSKTSTEDGPLANSFGAMTKKTARLSFNLLIGIFALWNIHQSSLSLRTSTPRNHLWAPNTSAAHLQRRVCVASAWHSMNLARVGSIAFASNDSDLQSESNIWTCSVVMPIKVELLVIKKSIVVIHPFIINMQCFLLRKEHIPIH
jgi:hypothetical protein